MGLMRKSNVHGGPQVTKKSLLTTKALLSKFLAKAPSPLQPLPHDIKVAINQLHTPSGSPEALWARMTALQAGNWLAFVHVSWWKETFSKLPQALHAPLLGLLPAPAAQHLAQKLQVEKIPELSQVAKGFWEQYLYDAYFPPGILPVELLPASPLNELVRLPGEQMSYIIELLGLRDLAHETLQVVDQKRLQAVRAFLSPSWQKALAAYQKRPDAIRPKVLLLPRWDGRASSLQALIRHYGFSRLTKALAGQHYSLVWHIARCIEQPLGRGLIEAVSVKALPATTEILVKQVIELIAMLQIGRQK